MIKLEVTGIKECQSYFKALAAGQLRFGVAKGLTDLADAARNEVVKGLPEKFTLRREWYKPRTKYGFNVQMAKKDALTATVYTRAPWMMLQETGGTKQVAGKRLAIPTAQVRRTKRDLVSSTQKPQALKKAFPIKLKSGKTMLAMRVGRGKSSQLRFMYTLTKTAQVKPRLHFIDTVRDFVNKYGISYLQKGLEYALRTAK